MLRWKSWSVTLSLLLAAAASACSDAAGTLPGDASTDAVLPPPPADALAPTDAGDGAAAVSATLRLAHLAPDLAPVDLCYRAGAAQWLGPVFGMPVDAGAPIGPMSFLDVSEYFTALGSGTFEIALVSAASQSCGQPLAIGHVTLDAGKRSTVVVMGLTRADAGAVGALTIASFTDDPSALADKSRARFIHAALGDTKAPDGLGALSATRVSLGFADFALAADIERGHATTASSAPPIVDALGYDSAEPSIGVAALRLSGMPLGRDADAGILTWETAASTLGTTAGSLHTGFIANDGLGGVVVLWCDDAIGTPTACMHLTAK